MAAWARLSAVALLAVLASCAGLPVGAGPTPRAIAAASPPPSAVARPATGSPEPRGGDRGGSPNPPPATGLPSRAAEWITHRRDDFRIDLPRSWLVTLPGVDLGSSVRFRALDPGGREVASARLAVAKTRLDRPLALDAIAGAAARALQREGVPDASRQELTLEPLGKLALLRWRRAEPDLGPGATTSGAWYILVRDRLVYELELLVPTAKESAYAAVFERIARSWRMD